MTPACPALLIAAPASGQGKTTVTAALARYHARRGRRVRLFKTGPDFLDPMVLEAASGHPVYQLDLWMMGERECRSRLHEAARSADLILIEGVMGLYDGDPSAADLAERLGVPVLAVIDASGMAETFAALVQGLVSWRPELHFAGFLANRVGSAAHAERLLACLPQGYAIQAALPRSDEVSLPSRHLGLVQATELTDLEQRLERLAERLIGPNLALLPEPVAFPAVAETVPQPQGLQGVRVGVARDEAFSFLYPANLEWLRQAGAEILFFSPLRDASIPPVDTLYLPGGYPELHLDQLAANESMKDSLRRHAEQAKPILAECGGMAYLAESLSDREGHSGAMCGILPGRVVMQSRLAGLGMQSADYPAGALRGHAFHYSRLETSLTPLLRARKRSGGEGEAIYRWRRVTASYLHLYFASSPETAAALLSP